MMKLDLQPVKPTIKLDMQPVKPINKLDMQPVTPITQKSEKINKSVTNNLDTGSDNVIMRAMKNTTQQSPVNLKGFYNTGNMQKSIETPDFGRLSTIGDNIDIGAGETAIEVAKGAGRGVIDIEKLPGQIAVMLGEDMQSKYGLLATAKRMPGLGSAINVLSTMLPDKKKEVSDTMVNVGQYMIDYWNEKQKGRLKPSKKMQDIRAGSFMDHPFARTFVGASESLPGYGSAVAATLITKNPNIGLALLGTQSTASSYEELRKENISPEIALTASVLAGSIEALTEKLPMDMLLKGGGKKFLIRAVQQGSVEAFEELFAALGQNYVQEVARNKGIKDEKGLDALRVEWDKITSGWQDSMAAGSLLGALGGAVSTGQQNIDQKTEVTSSPPEEVAPTPAASSTVTDPIPSKVLRRVPNTAPEVKPAEETAPIMAPIAKPLVLTPVKPITTPADQTSVAEPVVEEVKEKTPQIEADEVEQTDKVDKAEQAEHGAVEETKIYHHSVSKLDKLEQREGGIWFNDDPIGYTRRPNAEFHNEFFVDLSKLNLANKKQATEAGLYRGDPKQFAESLRDQGFDGIKIRANDETQYMILDVSKISQPTKPTTTTTTTPTTETPAEPKLVVEGVKKEGEAIPPKPVTEEASKKQPWEMTREESGKVMFGSNQSKKRAAMAAKFVKEEKQRLFGTATPKNPVTIDGLKVIGLRNGVPNIEGQNDFGGAALLEKLGIGTNTDDHALMIKQAIKEGKPVPTEVLAEYGITPEKLVEIKTFTSVPPVAVELLQSGPKATAELRKEISNVRYGKPGTILFDFRGDTYTTPEPSDIMPVGSGEKSRSWALKQLLSEKAKKTTPPPLSTTPKVTPPKPKDDGKKPRGAAKSIETSAIEKGKKAPPVPPKPKPATPVSDANIMSNKNRVIETKRTEKGLPPLKERGVVSNQETIDRARLTLEQDPTADIRLVESLKNKMRLVTLDEQALIDYRMLQLDNQALDLNNKLDEAVAAKDSEGEFIIRKMLLQSIEEFRTVSDINTAIATEPARLLQFRTRLVDQNYTLIGMLNKMSSAEGQELSAKETDKITKLHAELALANKKLKEALDREQEKQAKIQELEAQKFIESTKTSVKTSRKTTTRKTTTRKKYGSKNRLVSQEQYEKDLKTLVSGGLNVGIPPAKMAAVVRIGVYHIEAASRQVANVSYELWANKMRKDLGDAVRPHLKDVWNKAHGDLLEADQKDLVEKLDNIIEEGGDKSEIGRVIKQISRNTVASGKEDLKSVIEDVFNRVKDTMPDISELDILDILTDTGVYRAKNLSESQKAIKEFNKQAKRAKTLLDIKEGKINPARRRGVVSKSDAVKQLDDWITTQKKILGIDKRQVTEQQVIDRLDKKAAEIKERIRTGDYSKRTRKAPMLSPTIIARKAVVSRLKQQFDEMYYDAIVKKMPTSHKVFNVVMDIPAMIKNAMTGGEVSGIARQLLPTAFVDHKTYVESVKKTLKSYADPDYALTIREETESHPKYYAAKTWGNIQFSKAGSLSTEEVVASKWIDKIPIIGQLYKRGGAAFVDPQNWNRMQLFDILTEQYSKSGELSGDFAVAPTESDLRTMDRLGKWINDLTMRSSFGRSRVAKDVINKLNYVTFALRYSLAKASLVNTGFGMARSVLPTVEKYTDSNNVDRYRLHNHFDKVLLRQSTKALGKFLAFQTLVALAAYLADPEDNENIFNPWSADFFKVKDGNERYDFTAGLGAMVRFNMQFATGKRKSASGRYVKEDRSRILWRFLRSKEAPVINLAVSLWTGKNFMGVPTNRLKSVWDSFSMLFLNDAIDTFQNSGLLDSITALGAGIIGVGVQSYKVRAYTQLQRLEDDLAKDLYGVTWDKLTPSQTKELKQLPEYKDLAIKVKQEKAQEPYSFKQSKDLFDAGQRIYKSLDKDVREFLFDNGITTIGIGDKVQGIKLNEKRMAFYEKSVIKYIKDDLGDILNSGSRDDMLKEINKSKEKARKFLVELINSNQI